METKIRASNNQKRRGISIIWVANNVYGCYLPSSADARLGRTSFWSATNYIMPADASALAGARYVSDPDSSAGASARQKAWDYANATLRAQQQVLINQVGDVSNINVGTLDARPLALSILTIPAHISQYS